MRFHIKMRGGKCSVEAIENAVEFGEWDHFSGLYRHFPYAFWTCWICRYTGVEMADMHYLDGPKRKVFERFLKLCIWKEPRVRFHQITEHLNFINENCFACGRFMLRCLIRTMEDITKILKCREAVLHTVQGSPLISSRDVGRALDVIISLILLSPSSYVKCIPASFTLV